ncbi:hypothetical protein HG536_0A07940 [Torulaspora globosa]|uniref:Autophagy-related protein 29 n=1 Tax=Torulaspora globosa TaxID=48254 RepID=A0A7G3ZBU3_9SACH|nr:uncharacterized protein HG536_0A07940 [Torulaspora globosa]QLL30979.1 hypothetical protein HG536_0A07940 [Torulaspora globosa]
MDNHNTVVYVKVNGKRPPGFVDPQPFEWNSEKEKQLWAIISKLDDYQDQIDWKELAKNLDAPDYFLKKRSYKLFAMHLKLLEQQIERKMMAASENDGSRQTSVRQFDATAGMHTLTESSIRNQEGLKDKMADEPRDTTLKTLQQLHTSKILSSSKNPVAEGRDAQKGVGNNNASDSETSSNLSVSKSALEEALMDRLQL